MRMHFIPGAAFSLFPCLLPLIMALSRQSLFSLEDTHTHKLDERGEIGIVVEFIKNVDKEERGMEGESRVRKVWRVIKDHGSSSLVSGSRSEGFSTLSLSLYLLSSFPAVDVEVIVSSASSFSLFISSFFLTLFTRERHQRTPPEREERRRRRDYDLTRVTPCKIHGLQEMRVEEKKEEEEEGE